MILTLILACDPFIDDPAPVIEVASCDVIEARGECDTSPICVDVEDAMLSGVAYAWQCGGTGTAKNPGEADDCISRAGDAYALGDATGDRICVSCKDIDGDTGPSTANPWTYLILGVCEFGTIEDLDAATVSEVAR